MNYSRMLRLCQGLTPNPTVLPLIICHGSNKSLSVHAFTSFTTLLEASDTISFNQGESRIITLGCIHKTFAIIKIVWMSYHLHLYHAINFASPNHTM